MNSKSRIANTYGRFNMTAVSGKGATVKDAEGKSYIDFTSGIGVNSLGFCDVKWINAVTDQLGKLQHISNLYHTEPAAELARILTDRTGMENVFFCNSGAEANETAIKTAKKYGNVKKGREYNEIITLKNSFHGRTMATITATGQDHYHKDFTPFADGFAYCDSDDTNQLENLVNENTCAIMLEIIQGEGGVNDISGEFLNKAQELCQEKDLLLIVDEVQTGIGRTGKLFAFQHYDIEPDIVTFAKGIGAGLPLGGAIFGRRCCDVLVPGDHGCTFGGNPVICAGAIHVLSRLDSEMLADISVKGIYMRNKLAKMNGVGKLTGKGLMIGFEPEGMKASDIVSAALDKGLLLLTAADKVRMLPPLTISMKEIDRGLDILKDIISCIAETTK